MHFTTFIRQNRRLSKRKLKFIHVIEHGQDDTDVREWMKANEEYYNLQRLERRYITMGHERPSVEKLRELRHEEELKLQEALALAQRKQQQIVNNGLQEEPSTSSSSSSPSSSQSIQQ